MGLPHRGRRARGLCPCEPTLGETVKQRVVARSRKGLPAWLGTAGDHGYLRRHGSLQSGFHLVGDFRRLWPPLGQRAGHEAASALHRRQGDWRLTSVNGMAANRGLPSDYDQWAALGAEGWDWKGVLPSSASWNSIAISLGRSTEKTARLSCSVMPGIFGRNSRPR